MSKFLFPILLIITSCTLIDEQDDNFYFPVGNFLAETTYCFVNQNDTTEKSYWRMKTTVSNTDTLFRTSIYDNENRITETMIEKVANGNSKIDSYTIYQYDREGNKLSAKCKVIDSWVFKADQAGEEQIYWKVSFKDFYSPKIAEMYKTRTIRSLTYNEKTFDDQLMVIDTETRHCNIYSITSVYKKGTGLAAYKLVQPDGKVKDFILTSIK